MSEKNRWFVRAGGAARFVDHLVSEGLVALGWGEIGPLADDARS